VDGVGRGWREVLEKSESLSSLDSEGMFTFEMDVLRCIFFHFIFSFHFSSTTSTFTCRSRHVCFTGILPLHPLLAVLVVGYSCFRPPRYRSYAFFFNHTIISQLVRLVTG